MCYLFIGLVFDICNNTLLGGAVLTVAYSPDGNETGGIQLLGNSLPEGEYNAHVNYLKFIMLFCL